MYEKEIQQEIKRLTDPNNGKIKPYVLMAETFLDEPERTELRKMFHQTEYHSRHWKWHQLVRLVLEPQQTRQYMYDRLLSLILKHRRTYDDYFILKTQEGIYRIPNPLADLNKLEILYNAYFDLYRQIKNQIHFDYPKNEYVGPTIRGPINWDKTIRNSTTKFPLNFVSSIKQKEFETPENILLILCAEWMHRESTKLLQTNFKEPLSDYKKILLRGIAEKTKLILEEFPFTSILNESKRFWHLSYSDPRIIELEQKTRQRIKSKVIRNPNYEKLLRWISDFRDLDISRVTDKTPTRHILDSLENIDTVFEAWIFLEFTEFLHEKGILTNFKLSKKPHCQFEYGGVTVTFWYEKAFTVNEGHAWVLEHVPDFTVMLEDEILAVFDAKNYGKTSSNYSESQNKMLSYMNNLDANFGALIYSNHPKNWDDLTHDERIQGTTTLLNERFPEKTINEIRSMAKAVADLSWKQLPAEYKEISPPLAFKKFEHPSFGKKARFHFDQTLCLFRMSPEQTDQAIKIKNETLNEIFKAIVSRIPLTVKS